jgi:hypothetical protein
LHSLNSFIKDYIDFRDALTSDSDTNGGPVASQILTAPEWHKKERVFGKA